jgi:hypothetical protein
MASNEQVQIHDGAVIEIDIDGEAVTAMVLLAGDDMAILDTCDGSMPFVVRYEELQHVRVFEPEPFSRAA